MASPGWEDREGVVRYLKLSLTWHYSKWVGRLSPGGRLAWIALLTYAKGFGHNGRVKDLDPAQAATLWSLDANNVEEMLVAARRDGALSDDDGNWVVANWKKYQGDPTGAERQANHRKRVAAQGGPVPEQDLDGQPDSTSLASNDGDALCPSRNAEEKAREEKAIEDQDRERRGEGQSGEQPRASLEDVPDSGSELAQTARPDPGPSSTPPVRNRSHTRACVPASLDEVKDYCFEKGYPYNEAEAFFDHFNANGWRTGRAPGIPMRDWKAAMNGWHRRQAEFAAASRALPARRGSEEGDDIAKRLNLNLEAQ